MKFTLKKNSDSLISFIYIFGWLLLNFIAAGQTELYADEAYYWMYSSHLEWGYFDHPPMVALMIKIGTTVFGQYSEFGVRFMFVCMSGATMLFLYKLIPKVNPHVFFLSVFSLSAFNLISFMALPDVPLLFFTVVFFRAYQLFLEKNNFWYSLWLAFIIACLIYSKYHGVLIVGFVVLSNLKLFKNKYFYLVFVLSLLLIVPHLIWQANHQFPSIQYHLFERTHNYHIKYTLEFIFLNLLVQGPWASLFLIFMAYKYKVKDEFHKALKWCLTFSLLFFLYSTKNGRVEANWTIYLLVPLFLLGMPHLSKFRLKKLYIIGASVIAIALIVFKIHMIHPLLKLKNDKTSFKFHHMDRFVQGVYGQKPNANVVVNTYQEASLLTFYSPHHQNVSAINIHRRGNQFDFWKFDNALIGKDVYYVNDSNGEVIEGRRHPTKMKHLKNYWGPHVIDSFNVSLIRKTTGKEFYLCTVKLIEEVNIGSLYNDLSVNVGERFAFRNTDYFLTQKDQINNHKFEIHIPVEHKWKDKDVWISLKNRHLGVFSQWERTLKSNDSKK